MGETENKLREALDALKAEKPNDDTYADRRYAVVITELETVISHYAEWLVMPAPAPNADLTPIAKEIVKQGSKFIHKFPETDEAADK